MSGQVPGWQSPGRHPGWPASPGPAELPVGDVRLRPLRRSDGEGWRSFRLRDEQSIAPWEASSGLTWAERHSPKAWRLHRSALRSAARRGEVLPFALEVDGRFAGQVTIGGIQRGALASAWIGYWVESGRHGQGVATAAVALAVGHAFSSAGLYRLEATIAPANVASLAVVRRLGFRQEGLLQRYLDVGGARRDHLLWAITAAEVPGGTAQLLASIARHRPDR